MSPDLSPILDKLRLLGRRERGLLAARGALVGFGLGLVAWAAAMGFAAMGWDRKTSLEVLGAVGLAALVTLGIWLGMRWQQAGSAWHQARLLEALQPDIRGRLITLLERVDGPRGQESVGILALVARRARALVEPIPPQVVHPGRALVRPVLAAFALLMAWGLVGVLGPMGPVETLRWLGGDARAVVSTPADPDGPIEARALVGDLLIRYEYPEYTGLPPTEVPNSNGDVHGPPGTRVSVRARTAEVYDSAAIQAYDLPPLQAGLVEGRDVAGAFTIDGEGAWRLLLRRGAEQHRSPDYDIVVEPDLPPVVELDAAADRMEVAWDQTIPLRWRVRDDFGVTAVQVRIVGQGKPQDLRRPLDTPTLLPGDLERTPDQLGLRPGDEVELRIVGWDNDAISGAKSGESRSVRIFVLGPRAQAERFLRLRRELRDALIDVLADFVTDPDPLPERQAALSRWAAGAAGRFEPIDDLVDEYWDRFDERSLEGRVVEEIRRQGNGLLRFVHAVAAPKLDEPVDERDMETVGQLRAELVETLETNVLMLDLMVRYQAIGELYNQARRLDDAGELLRGEAEAGGDAGALFSRLDRVETLSRRLAKAADEYDDGRLSAMVKDWLADADRLSDRIRELIAEGDLERARQLSVTLANQLDRLRRSLEAMQSQMEEATEEDMEAIREFIKELERIEAEERALLERTRQAREHDGVDADQLVRRWEQAAELARQVARSTQEVTAAFEADGKRRVPTDAEDAERLRIQAERMLRVIEARDLDNARLEASRTLFLGRHTEDMLRRRERRYIGEPDAPDNTTAYQRMREAQRTTMTLDDILRDLDQAVNDASPTLAREADAFAESQGTLLEDTTKTLPFANQLAGQLPMGAPGLVESLEGAEREMTRAERALDQARAVEAEGAEEAAADRVRQALEALAQAAAAMEEMQEQMDGGQPDQDGAGGGDGEDDQRHPPTGEVALPDPEEFATPEEYREALLRGMQAEVPEQYEALKRRYYEELVRQ
ncbi:MAG: DUF4175 family protein [Alphaproteobacteria bacterium]|nr:DUF4175 family protein [Alphaproteobacteria bacterium]